MQPAILAMKNYSKRGRTTKNKEDWDYFKSPNRKLNAERERIENCRTLEELQTRLKYNRLLTKDIKLIKLCEEKIRELKNK